MDVLCCEECSGEPTHYLIVTPSDPDRVEYYCPTHAPDDAEPIEDSEQESTF